jgi:hypothetical protein
LDKILSIQSVRKINNDYTVRFQNGYYQLNEIQPTTVYKRDEVVIEEHLNGEIKIAIKNKYLEFVKLPERPKKEIEIKLAALTNQKQAGHIPPADHHWRAQFLINKRQPLLVAVK